LSAACYNLVYLELANCRLATLPPGLSALVPNLRALNLNYNFLEDVRGLEGLNRLRKLSVVGTRLKVRSLNAYRPLLIILLPGHEGDYQGGEMPSRG
jgi:Leucine-rich repeat (LRR) protein